MISIYYHDLSLFCSSVALFPLLTFLRGIAPAPWFPTLLNRLLELEYICPLFCGINWVALKTVCRFATESCWGAEPDVDVTAEMVVAKLTFRLREDLDVGICLPEMATGIAVEGASSCIFRAGDD